MTVGAGEAVRLRGAAIATAATGATTDTTVTAETVTGNASGSAAARRPATAVTAAIVTDAIGATTDMNVETITVAGDEQRPRLWQSASCLFRMIIAAHPRPQRTPRVLSPQPRLAPLK